MSRNTPLVSTVIATHNRPQLLLRTLNNLAEQNWRPLEVIIVDDGSRYPIENLVLDWHASRRPGISIRYQWQKNQGPAVARNRGVEMSAGDFVHFLDDDDLMHPQALSALMAALRHHQGAAIAMASYCYWAQGRPQQVHIRPSRATPRQALASMIRGDWFVPVHGYLFTRAALARIGPWNPALTSQEDDEFLLRAAIANIALCPAPAATVYYCQHEGQRRSVPGGVQDSVLRGMQKRMHAASAIRHLARQALEGGRDVEHFRPAFTHWTKRFRQIYAPVLQARKLPPLATAAAPIWQPALAKGRMEGAGMGAGAYSQTASGGSDIRMASTLPPVFRPKVVPRS